MPMMMFFLLVSVAFAGQVTVEGHRGYDLLFDDNHINLVTPAFKVNLQKQKCSSKVFESFEMKIKKFSLLPMLPGHQREHLNYRLNGKDFHAEMNSSLAKFVDSLPEEIERMKIEEKLRCK